MSLVIVATITFIIALSQLTINRYSITNDTKWLIHLDFSFHLSVFLRLCVLSLLRTRGKCRVFRDKIQFHDHFHHTFLFVLLPKRMSFALQSQKAYFYSLKFCCFDCTAAFFPFCAWIPRYRELMCLFREHKPTKCESAPSKCIATHTQHNLQFTDEIRFIFFPSNFFLSLSFFVWVFIK